LVIALEIDKGSASPDMELSDFMTCDLTGNYVAAFHMTSAIFWLLSSVTNETSQILPALTHLLRSICAAFMGYC